MERRHARYPFLDDAKDAVEAAEIDPYDIVQGDASPVLDRAIERVRSAITDGRVSDPVSATRVEVLSYPIARILVSLVENPVLTDRYALAEARRAFALLERELDPGPELESVDREYTTLPDLFVEFDLADRVREVEGGYEFAVTAYLRLSTELRGAEWRLVNRALADGTVPIQETELRVLLREAIRLRVADGLPLDVPEPIAEALESEVNEIRASLDSVSIPSDIDRVEPDLFPTCMAQLHRRATSGETLGPDERFVLVAFLCAIGADEERVQALVGGDAASTRENVAYQVERVHGQTRSTAYPPPSCETLAAMGICPEDGGCREHGHPLAAYAARLAAAR